MATEVLSSIYTSQGQIERLFSSIGVELRIDDLTGAELAAYWVEVTSEATDIINQYCEPYYEATDMVDNLWVRTRATWIGAYLLSQRRGNQVQFYNRYEEIIGELIAVSLGQLLIPRLPTRSDFTPAMSNQFVDDRHRFAKLRTIQVISTGGNDSRQNLLSYVPYEWL